MRIGKKRQSLAFVRTPRTPRSPRSPGTGRRIGLAVAVLVCAVVAAGIVIATTGGRPTAELASPVAAIGRDTPVSIVLRAGRSGLGAYEVVLLDAAGERRLASEDLPGGGLLGNDVREKQVDLRVDAEAAKATEGDARIVVRAIDASPFAAWRSPVEVLSAPVVVDLTPPKITPLSGLVGRQTIAQGGSALAVYTVSPDTVRSGVEIGRESFAGRSGAFADPATHAALFAIPHDVEAGTPARIVAVDAAGNRREIPLSIDVKPKRFPAEEIVVNDEFLGVKVPELLAQNGLPPSPDLVAGYLVVNRDLRRTTEERLREITRDSAPGPLIDGAFIQQPGTQVGSRFAEQRTYRYKGEVIDRQTHLGTDLASVKQAPIVAANSGRVVFAGNLGIYGEAVVIDHGLGLASLYAHLSHLEATAGQSVRKGDTIGRSGDTGLAGGDHLHYSVLVDGVHVDPVEWWDAKWIRDHIAPQLAVAPAAAAAAAPSRAATQGEGSAGAPPPSATANPVAAPAAVE